MSHSYLDPDHEHISNPTLDILADPFRRRLLSAAVLTAIGCALLAVGIPFPAQAAEAGNAAAIEITRDFGAPASAQPLSLSPDPTASYLPPDFWRT